MLIRGGGGTPERKLLLQEVAPGPVTATTEEYNGSGWSAGGNNVGTARYEGRVCWNFNSRFNFWRI